MRVLHGADKAGPGPDANSGKDWTEAGEVDKRTRVGRVRRHTAIGAALALLTSAGCGWLGNPVDGGTPSDGGGAYGYGKPALQVTVGGMHFGPAIPDTGSGVDLTTVRDQNTGTASQTDLRITASSAATGASCALAFERFGDGVAPFHAGAGYQVSSEGTFGATPDGTVAVPGGLSVSVPGGTFQCSGTTCDGSVLLMTVLAADHVEGTWTGTLDDTAGRGSTSVVCSFYLPTRTFMP
jgi:hypothetical protein